MVEVALAHLAKGDAGVLGQHRGALLGAKVHKGRGGSLGALLAALGLLGRPCSRRRCGGLWRHALLAWLGGRLLFLLARGRLLDIDPLLHVFLQELPHTKDLDALNPKELRRVRQQQRAAGRMVIWSAIEGVKTEWEDTLQASQ